MPDTPWKSGDLDRRKDVETRSKYDQLGRVIGRAVASTLDQRAQAQKEVEEKAKKDAADKAEKEKKDRQKKTGLGLIP